MRALVASGFELSYCARLSSIAERGGCMIDRAERPGEITQFEPHFDRFRPPVGDRRRERPGAGA
jgi:hypothetical protein